MEKWKTTSSKIIVDDKWLKLRIDSCVTSSGSAVPTYYVLEYNDWANCVVLGADDELIMIRQYRHGIGDFVSEFVGGEIEKGDPSPEAGIKRELEEEIGYTGGEIYQTGVSYPNPGNQTNKVYSYLAVGGSCSKEQQLEDTENLTVEKKSLDEVIQDLEDPSSGVVYQSMHITALFFALNFIKHSSLVALQPVKEKLAKRVTGTAK
jgi:ADP-ribose pyrophosphatase